MIYLLVTILIAISVYIIGVKLVNKKKTPTSKNQYFSNYQDNENTNLTENIRIDIQEEINVDKPLSIKGKITKSKLNAMTKKQLVDAVKNDFDETLDISVKKSTLVNKVYSTYNRK